MQRIHIQLLVWGLLFLSGGYHALAQKAGSGKAATAFALKTATENGYTYEYVEGDPMKVRIYTLKNGLKVYLSRYTEAPRIYTMIGVNAGGRNDPAQTTGLAHYLEHIMFKGTTNLGTQNWAQEKVYLDSIEHMYEHYRTLTDPQQRKDYYALIDKVSNEASAFCIANEYDKAVSVLGASGTNAFTSQDQTVYVNDIPANELKRWLELERERFTAIIPRLFHTELEAVYEEKNRALDNDGRKVYEKISEVLFSPHPYGSQTVIGTVEHLKNPSITNILAYFYKYYVPNNMSVCLGGDFEYAEAIKLVDATFGTMPAKPLEKPVLPKAAPLTQNVEHTIYGPTEESVNIAFPFAGANTADALMIEVIDMLLSNSSAGLIDLNLNQEQKVLGAGSSTSIDADYSYHAFYGTPREGQALTEVRDLLLAQLDSIRQGKFADWLLDAVITDLRLNRTRQFEDNQGRVYALVSAFGMGVPWQDYCSEIDRMDAITREQIIEFAKTRYNNHVVIYKKIGEDTNIQKVEKPSINPVQLNRDKQSAYLTQFMASPAPRLQPRFLDYKSDIQQATMKSNIQVLGVKNVDNDLFELTYYFEAGNNADPKMRLAIDYLSYLGTKDLEASAFQQEMYKLGCSFNVFAGDDRTYVSLSGLNVNMEKATALFESLLATCQPDEDALKDMIAGIKKQRINAKKSKGLILNAACANYGKYGKNSAFTNILTNDQLDALTGKELTELLHNITTFEHKVLYYGPRELKAVVGVLNKLHKVPAALKPLVAKDYAEIPMTKTRVYWVNYDMVQAEVMMLAKGQPFDPARVPMVTVYNEYFGGSMNAIVFQELREARGLAYSVSATYQSGTKKGRSDYMRAYIGTQADKLGESLAGMTGLLETLPQGEKAFNTAKDAIMSRIETERITKSSKIFSLLTANRLGVDHDLRQDTYAAVPAMTLQTITEFQQKYVKGQPYTIFVLGSKDRLDFEVLKQYGEVQELTLEEIFGY